MTCRRYRVLLVVQLILTLWAAGAAQGDALQRIIYVRHAATGKDDGSSWAHAYADLPDALRAAQRGDEIWVAAGIYYPAPDALDRTAAFALKDGVALYGGFAGTETEREQRDWEANVTVLSGDLDRNDDTDARGVVTDTANIVGENAYHVITGAGVTNAAMLDGFIITAGSAAYSGGGMHNWRSSPMLTDLTFAGNRAAGGGGMYNYESTRVLTGVTFSDNRAEVDGGGMLNQGVSPTLTNVTFTGNQAAADGGGMFNGWDSSSTLTDVTFAGNRAAGGGGMYNYESTPVLTGVTFSGNQADDGGGMRNLRGSPTLNNVTFAGNQAAHSGGGMYNAWSSGSLVHAAFSDNRANHCGGGMYNHESGPALRRVNFSGNESTGGNGGGMCNAYSRPTLTNVNFGGNKATGRGGGVYNLGVYASPRLTNVTFGRNKANEGGAMYNRSTSSPTLANCILWGNSPDEIYNDEYSSATITYSDVRLPSGVYTGTGNINQSPLFVAPVAASEAPTTAGDYRLRWGSSAVDAGSNGAVPEGTDTDLDGNPRIVDGTGDGDAVVDMGAYELQNGSLEPYTIMLQGLSRLLNAVSSRYVITNGGSVEATTWHEFFDEDGILVAAFSDKIPAGAERTYDLTTLSDLPDGYFGYAIVSADQPITGATLDVLPPSSTATVSPYTNSSLIVVSWTASDDDSGVASTTLWTRCGSEGTWASTEQTQTGTEGTFSYSPMSGEGVYYFATVATDHAGNAEAPPTGDGDTSTLYDLTKPASQVQVPGLERASSVSLPWAASDNLSGVANTTLWVRFGPQGTWTATDLSQSGMQGTFVYPFTRGEGTYYFAAVSIDRAGNQEDAPSAIGDGGCEYRFYRVHLPLALRDYVRYFEGPREAEPNNNWQEANGPLISGRDYYGYPNDQKDYFSIYVRRQGEITVSLTGHTGQHVQLQLFDGPPKPDSSNVVADAKEKPYELTHDGEPGWYYIYINTGAGYNSDTRYTVRVTYPE